MCKRALFIFDWHRFTNIQLEFIQQKSDDYEELIFLIDRPEEILFCGDLLEQLNKILSKQIAKPFYLLPVPRKNLSDMYYWIRCRILSPTFEKVYLSHSLLQSFIREPVEIFDKPDKSTLITNCKPSRKSRGLFITRAQPFHVGHAAILGQIMEEKEEVIVIVAMANESHTHLNVATAGERLAMILPLLNEMIPGRYYLAAMPYSNFTMENFYELEYLFPSFESVHTNNPIVKAMAQTAGYQIKVHPITNGISSTSIRKYMCNDQSFENTVPVTVYKFLSQSCIPQRLKTISENESR